MSTDNEKWGRLKYLAQKATPGPWWVDSHGHRVSTADGMQTVFVADDKMGPAVRHKGTGNLSHWPNDWDASYIVTAHPAAILELLEERDTFLEDRISLIEENGHLYGEIADLRHALTLCVASLDQLLPYLAKVPADVGLLNDALMAARPLLDDTQPKPLNLDAPFILSYELKDNPGFEYERHAADLNDARVYLQSMRDMVAWAELSDSDGNVVAGTEDLV